VKIKYVFGFILLLLIADQALKFWVKTHMFLYDEIMIFKPWFRLYFIENEGMAYGAKFGEGDWAKLALTLFRLGAVIFGTFYLIRICKQRYHKGFIICAALIYAGAMGNLVDSLFYGMIFTKSHHMGPLSTAFQGNGYAGFLHGSVVDMLYFPIVNIDMMPSWVPIWGGKPFTFFQPIFNIADACISVGVICILLFQHKFFHKHQASADQEMEGEKSKKVDEMQAIQ
jgi:signal peptidase II